MIPVSRLARGTRALVAPLALLVSVASAARAQTPVPVEDYGKWESLGQATLSPDGSWLAVAIGRVNDEDELRIHPVDRPDSVVTVPYGSSAAFSPDGRWLAWSIGVGEEERERLRRRDEPVRNGMGLMDLESGEVTEVEAVASFTFSPDGRWLAMRRYAPDGEREAEGVDVVVRELDGGPDTNFGNVSELAWRDDAPVLAMVVDAEGMAGNGVQVWDARERRLTPLESRATRYSGLGWREDASDLAVLRRLPAEAGGEEAWADTAWSAVAFMEVTPAGATRSATLDPAVTQGFPDSTRIVPWERPRWREGGGTLLVGIQPREPVDPCEAREGGGGEEEEGEGDPGEEAPEEEPAPAEEGEDACPDEDEDAPTVEIWHAGDVDIVPTQKVRADRDRRENHVSAWHLEEDRFVQLETELTENVQLAEGVATAVGLDGTPYDPDRMFGPVYRDVWLVDTETGEREKALERVQYFFGMSPEGGYLLWLEDDHWWSYDVASGERANLTEGLPTSFVDLENDLTVEQKPPHGVAGWLENDEAVLLYDEHDVWRVAPDGSGGERMTDGAGENVRHRRVRVDPDEDAIDPDAPQLFTLYDDWTERWGYGRADRLGGEVERLLWEEARVYGLTKADSADVWAYRVEDFEDSPDVFVARGGDLSDARQVTATNPFQSDYAWGRSELVEFTNTWGDTLQGALYYPAEYEPGRRYPMIVYIYETRSNAVRSYDVPSERDYYNFQAWVQDGYLVFQPDIVYRDRDPGVSAVASLEPAVQAVVEMGLADPERVGLIGHSWGGYQTTFAVTQTDVFSAAVAGAPLTNLFSMYLSIYWNSGGTDARIFEISQGRMEVPFWEDEASYRRNSPVFHIEELNTPLLMAQGTEDGAVDFNQGVEFYNAARRAGKDFVFLVYNGENHGFRQEANQLDYHRRINEWFGHYLKGEPAPAWITEGVPFLEQPTAEERRR